MATLQPEVRDYEPSIALDGGEDGLVFYRILSSIFSIIAGIFFFIFSFLKHLFFVGNNPQALAFLEIGFGQKDDITEILERSKEIAVWKIHKDKSEIDRCIVEGRSA